MADEKKTTQQEAGKGPAANGDLKQYKEKADRYKHAQQVQEVLQKSIAQYAQEGQQAQEVLADNCEFNPETGAIMVNNEARPELDPNSPQFDPVLYNDYAASINKRLTASIEQLETEVKAAAKDIMNTEAMQQLRATITEKLAPVLDNVAKTVSNVVNNDAYKGMLQGIADTMQYILDHNEELAARVREWEQIQPYLEEELKKPEYDGRTMEDLLNNEYKDENGDVLNDSLFEKAFAAARAAMLADTAKQLPRLTVSGKGTSNIEYPLDKINANIWTLLKDADKDGQLTFRFAAEKRGSKKQADIIYSINFNELENAGLNTVKRLTAFDKRVYIAASALYNGSSDFITVSQLYATMGNDSRPNARDIERIYTSLEKMRRLPITLDNTDENSKYGNMAKFVYNGVLLPWESIDAVVNGQKADGVIHLFREPPLVSFAKERKQVTTVSRKLLTSPISKTDANLQLDDYLIEHISHIKHSKGKLSNKLLYTTIYDKAGIKTKMQRSRAKDKIRQYLDHYKSCGFIKDYKEAADGVTIRY